MNKELLNSNGGGQMSENVPGKDFCSIKRKLLWWKIIAIVCAICVVAILFATQDPPKDRKVKKADVFSFDSEQEIGCSYDILTDVEIVQDYAYLIYKRNPYWNETDQIAWVGLDAEQGVWEVRFYDPYSEGSFLGLATRYALYLSQKTGEVLGARVITI